MSQRRGEKIDQMLQYAVENPPFKVAPYVHGTYRCYAHGCKTTECKAAAAAYARKARKRRKEQAA